jgi:membrane protein YqaA with SNARE-associated domain
LNILAGFADISLGQLLLVACIALFASVVGGLASYGTGALMPLVLVPLLAPNLCRCRDLLDLHQSQLRRLCRIHRPPPRES